MPTLHCDTSFGPVDIYVHDSNRITLRSENSLPVVVNRVPLAFRLELERVEVSGQRAEIGSTGWTYGHTYWTVHPENWRKMNQYPTDSCRDKVRQVLIPECLAALSESPDVFDDADRERLSSAVRSAEATVSACEAKLNEALAALEVAQAAFVAFESSGVMA